MKVFSKTTVITLSNAVELTNSIVSKVMGKEVANTLNGSIVNRNTLNQIVSARIANKFNQVARG